MPGLGELMREYERARFPADRRLDLQAEGPGMARERALRWIQSRAHESPGQELLLVLERGVRPGRRSGPVASAVERLLDELSGGLIEGWQLFTPGTVAVKVSPDPRMTPPSERGSQPEGDGRTAHTAGPARPRAREDIPAELLEVAERTAELRLQREGLSVRLEEVVLREIWIEAQAIAMAERVSFEAGLERVLDTERARSVLD